MKKILITGFCLAMSVLSFSQSSNDLLLKKLVEKNVLTETEAKELKDETEATEKSKKFTLESLSPVVSSKYMRLSGYAQLLYSYSSSANVKNDFTVRNAFVNIKGNALKDLSYSVFFNFKGATLVEYDVIWSPLKELKFRIGQQKTLLGIDNVVSLSQLEFIQNTRLTNNLLGGAGDVQTQQSGKNSAGRDIGIKAYGNLLTLNNHDFLEYGIAVYQGSGINESAYRSDKDFAAQLYVYPLKDWKIGGGAYFGGAVYALNQGDPRETHVRNRWLLSTEYKTSKVFLRSEYVKAYDSTIRREGVYAAGGYTFFDKLQPIARYDYYVPDTAVRSSHVNDYTVGLNYYFTPACRIQGNYTYSDYSKSLAQKDNHRVEVQFQIIY